MQKLKWMAAGLGVLLGGAAWGAVASSEDHPKVVDGVPAGAPERVEVSDRDGRIVGTVAREDLAPPASGPRLAIEVLDRRGTLVGHMVPGIGYVSLEESSSPGYDEERLREQYPTTTVLDAPVVALPEGNGR